MAVQTTIRRAKPEDAERIAALVAEAYSGYLPLLGQTPAPMREDYRQVVADFCVFVGVSGADLQAVVVLSQDKTELYLHNIAVSPRDQGTGLGKTMMRFCEDHAQALGCDALQLYTHQLMTENIARYHRWGFRESHRATADGFARVFMRKAIAPRST